MGGGFRDEITLDSGRALHSLTGGLSKGADDTRSEASALLFSAFSYWAPILSYSWFPVTATTPLLPCAPSSFFPSSLGVLKEEGTSLGGCAGREGHSARTELNSASELSSLDRGFTQG